MSVQSHIWVKAHLRRCFAQGLSGVVVSRGAPEAGAVFVRVIISRDETRLFAPPPGPLWNEAGERNWFEPLGNAPVTPQEAEAWLARQKKFDPDIWIIDIDDRSGTGLLAPA